MCVYDRSEREVIAISDTIRARGGVGGVALAVAVAVAGSWPPKRKSRCGRGKCTYIVSYPPPRTVSFLLLSLPSTPHLQT